jgi:hypothetical protein
VGKASAVTLPPPPTYLCVVDTNNNNLCAYAHGPNPVVMTGVQSSTTNWYYPTGGSGDIAQANTTNCMQVDASAGYKVIEGACNGATYQLWNVVNDVGATGYYQFQSEYNKAECLTYNAVDADLIIGGCGKTDWYQHFYPETKGVIITG